MNVAQRVTVKEFFKLSMEAQKDFLIKRRDLAKDYIKRTTGFEGIHTITEIKRQAEDQGCGVIEMIRVCARKQLLYLQEKDLIEYMAEHGLAVFEARYDDKLSEVNKKCLFPDELMIMDEITDLLIVPSTERPNTRVTVTDLFPPGYQFMSLEKKEVEERDPWADLINYSAPDKKITLDKWDKMSESEWKEAKEAEEEYKKSVLLSYNHEKQQYLNGACGLYGEYCQD